MTTNHHVPIVVGASAAAATINAPLAELDDQITAEYAEIVAGRGGYANLDTRMDAIGAAWAAGDAVLDDRINDLIINSGTSDAETIAARTAIQYGTAPATLGDALNYAALDIHNALAYGADNTGASSSDAALEAAAAAATGAAGGGMVYIPAGTYTIDSFNLKSNVIYRGAGVDKTILRKTSVSPTAGVGVLYMNETGVDIKNIVIEDMTIDQPRNVAAPGIYLLTDGVISNVTLQRLKVNVTYDLADATAVQLGNTAAKGAICDNVHILDCYISGPADAVTDNYALFVTPGSRVPNHGNQLIVQRCEIEGGREGFSQQGSDNANPLVFDANYVHGQTWRGAMFYHGLWNRITNNMFTNITAVPFDEAHDGGAVWLDNANPGPGSGLYRTSVFSGNIVRAIKGNGIYAEEWNGGAISNNAILEIETRDRAITAILGNGTTVTATVADAKMFVDGGRIRISDTTSYNGDFVITSINFDTNVITWAGTGTGAESSGKAWSLFKAADNANTSVGGHGLLLTGGCIGTAVQNNRIEAVENNGIMLCRDFGPHSSIAISHVHISGNRIYDIGNHGIHLDGAYRAITGHLRIVSNYISNTSETATPRAAVYSDATVGNGGIVNLIGNTMSNFFHGYYHTGTETTARLIANWIQANAAGYAIYHNIMESGSIYANHINQGLVDFGTLGLNTVKHGGNTGWVDEKHGKLTGGSPDGNGNLVQAHGLSATPSYVSVHILGDRPDDAVVQALDATNITIRIRNSTTNADVTTGTASVYWYARL